MARASLFDQTAEIERETKRFCGGFLTCHFMVTQMIVVRLSQFEGENYAERLAAYDQIEEDGTEFQERLLKN